MSYTSLLIDTCTTRRYSTGAADAYGNPTETWADYLTDQPCRLNIISGVELKVGAELVIANYQLFVEDIDITEQDRVVIDSVTYEILLVKEYQDSSNGHHKQCLLRVSR